MKYTIASLVALACASSSFAVTLGTAPAVTVALTASENIGGFKVVDPDTKEVTYEYEKSTVKKDKNGELILTTTEYKQVPLVVRVGNAELLKALNESGMLPDSDVKGWSIVSVSSVGDYSDTGPDGLFAVKKGQVPVEIPVEFPEEGQTSYTISSKYTYAPATDTYVTVSSSSNGKELTGISFFGFNIQGISTNSEKYVKGTFGKGSSAITYEASLAGVSKLAGISGTNYVEDEDLTYIVEGSISAAAEVVLDLETRGFDAAQQP